MESQKILESLFDKNLLAILKLFLKRKDQQFYLKEVSKQTKTPLSSTHRLLNKLVDLDILERTKIKHLKIYSLKDNDKTKYLENIFEEKKTILDEFVDMIKEVPGIKSIIVHGREEKDKANILVIGDGIDNSLIRDAIVKIREKYGFAITHLSLTDTQFEQMAAMNLYPGKKEVLFEKLPSNIPSQ